MSVKLKVLHGPSAGKEVKITGSQFVIGRGDDCHLRPKSDAISRRHCEITIADSQVCVMDLGSKNGTHVNGDRIEGKRPLKTGDCLKVGPLDFEVVIEVGIANGEKRPKVNNVKEAAARVADSSGSVETDIGSWLQELDDLEREKQTLDPATRQFKLEETDRVALEDAATKEQEAATAEAKADQTQSGTKRLVPPTKQPPMKLPPRQEEQSANSRDAAADMLKRFFNRR